MKKISNAASTPSYTEGVICQLCSAKKLVCILDLGHQPMTQEYLTSAQLNLPEKTYPLHLCCCDACGLVQLDYVASPETVFPDAYPYRTGLTNMLIRNFQALAETLSKKGYVKKGGLIVDIGSNDGTLLKNFVSKGMRVVGIEPTDAAKDAVTAGITTLQEYITPAVAKKLVSKHGQADIVTATNAFAHIPDVPALMQCIDTILKDDGVFVSESQYLRDILEGLEFDTIYHEHLRFYSLTSLAKLFSTYGWTVVDAERISAAGGSIRAYAMKGKHPSNKNVRAILAEEKKEKINERATLLSFAQKAREAKRELLSLLLSLQKQGKRIVAVSSPARSNTLLNFCRIDSDTIDYAGEKRGSPKIGLFTPGAHIAVVDEAQIFADQPDYCLILSWHIGKELSDIIKKRGFTGKCIVPLPTPRII